MRNFVQISKGLDTVPVLNALAQNPDLWNENTLRTTYPGTPHAQVDDIWVFFNETDANDVTNDLHVRPYRAWARLPELRPLVFDIMRYVGGTRIGRVLISRLPPGKSITPHADGGAPVTYFTRYQVALQSLPGVVFRAGDEKVQMANGDVWWFDNSQEHEVINYSADDRIAMVMDIRRE